MRRLTTTVVALVVAAGLVLVPVAGASATTTTGGGSWTDPDDWGDQPSARNPFKPSASKPRAFMINVLGSMLGAATPDRWKREQLANQYRYNHSWEQLAAQHDVAPNGGYLTSPSSYDDYVLRNIEKAEGVYYDENGVKRGGFKAPATMQKKLTKTKISGGIEQGIGVLTGSVIGFQAGVAGGKVVAGWIGHDVEAGLCAPTFDDGGMIALLTGTDCDAWMLDNEYVPNGDVEGGIGLNYCWNDDPNLCVTYLGSYTYNTTNYWAYGTTAPDSASIGIAWRTPGSTNWTNSNLAACSVLINSNVGCREMGAQRRFGTSTSSGTATAPIYPDRYEFCQRFTAANLCATDSVVIPEEVAADPERTTSCEILATDGNTYTSTSEPYRESEGSLAPSACPDLPPGVYPQNFTVAENGPNGRQELYNENTTPEYRDWLMEHPNCVTGACKLDLLKIGTGAPVSCFDIEEGCAGWFEDPAKADLYQCVYGGTAVELAECNVYAPVFDPDRLAVGAPYADPITGEWSGGQSSPAAGSALMNGAVQDPEAMRDCWGQGWAEFNPVEWIMQPVRCALEWAFVPRQTIVALAGQKASTAFEEVAPGQVAAMVGGWSIAPSMSGCRRTAPFDANPFDQSGGEVLLWDVCPGSDMEMLGTISRTVVTLGLVVLVVTMIRRNAMKMVS